MWVGSQWFSPETVNRIQDLVAAEPTMSRRELSRQVCDWLDWKGPDGKPKDMACRKALGEMNRRGVIELPPAKQVANFSSGIGEKKVQTTPPELEEVRCSLEELGTVEVVPISSRSSKDSSMWKAMMEHFHYLGAGPLCGAHLPARVSSTRFQFCIPTSDPPCPSFVAQ